jgi:hypothetical protein
VGANLLVLSRGSYLGQDWDDWLDKSLVPRISSSLYSRGVGGCHGFVGPSIAIGASLTDDSWRRTMGRVERLLTRRAPICESCDGQAEKNARAKSTFVCQFRTPSVISSPRLVH